MATIRECERAATARGIARVDVRLLLAHAAGRPWSWFVAHADEALDAAVQAAFEAALERRVAGEPVAYILGRRGFWSLDLDVSPATLIPRPETELLVECALERMVARRAPRIADLGTGSGAVALALARERPDAAIVAVDISAAALAVARRNALRLQVANVGFVQGDWLSAQRPNAFDLVVANPPYIEDGDPHLGRGDVRFEPRLALVSGADGLDAIRRIVAGARGALATGGWLLMEHGWRQGAAVRALLVAAGYVDVSTAPDLEQRDRVSGGRAPLPA